jgi:hypothetical protein
MGSVGPERMVQRDGMTSVTPQPISTAAVTPLAARTERSRTVIALPAESWRARSERFDRRRGRWR